MAKVENIQQAIDEVALLLERDQYQALERIHEICRIFLAQSIVLELRNRYNLTYINIGLGVGVNEKTIRYNWLGANDCPKPEHLIALAKYYLEVKRSKVF